MENFLPTQSFSHRAMSKIKFVAFLKNSAALFAILFCVRYRDFPTESKTSGCLSVCLVSGTCKMIAMKFPLLYTSRTFISFFSVRGERVSDEDALVNHLDLRMTFRINSSRMIKVLRNEKT